MEALTIPDTVVADSICSRILANRGIQRPIRLSAFG